MKKECPFYFDDDVYVCEHYKSVGLCRKKDGCIEDNEDLKKKDDKE